MTLLDDAEPSAEGIEDIYPLSPLQRGLLFHTLAAPPDSGMYVNQLTLELDARVDRDTLQRAWESVVARHTILRTAFEWDDLDEPVQVVHREAPLPWRDVDVRGAPPDEAAAVAAILAADRLQGFDLTVAPAMRVALLRATDRAVLVWTHHHVLLDGWSAGIVLREVMASYEAIRGGRTPKLGPAFPYGEFIEWLGSRDADAADAYWRRALAGVARPTRLPGEGTLAKRSDDAAGGVVAAVLAPAVTSALATVAQREGVTVGHIVHAAWAIVLARYADVADVVFGTTVTGRPPELRGHDDRVGLFINTVPIRVRPTAAKLVRTLLHEVRAEQGARSAHEHRALPEIQAVTAAPRTTPLFESSVVYQNFPAGGGAGGTTSGAKGNARALTMREQGNVPLTFRASPGDGLELELLFQPERFSEATATRVLRHVVAALTSMSERVDVPIGSLALGVGEARQGPTWNEGLSRYADEHEARIAYWRRELTGSGPLELPVDRARGATTSARRGSVPITIPADLAQEIARAFDGADTGLVVPIATATAVVVARLAGQDDVVVAVHDGTTALEHLPLRFDLARTPSFRDVVTITRERLVAGRSHGAVTLGALHSALRPSDGAPLVQVLVGIGDGPATEHGPKLDLALRLAEHEHALRGELSYDADLFDAPTAERFARAIVSLLDAARREPDAPARKLPLMDASDRARVLALGARKAHAAREEACLDALFEARARLAPDRIAVIAGEETLTYGVLDRRANRVARRLQRLGVRPGDRVALSTERGQHLLVGLLGILKAGAAYVPLDPTYPRDRLLSTMADARVAAFVGESTAVDAIPTDRSKTVLLDRDDLSRESDDPLPPSATPDSVAYVIYTSGSTGRPKGTLVTHANVLALFRACERDFDLRDTDVWSLFHSYAFDFSVWELWGALLYGGKVVVVPYWVSRSPDAFHDLLVREKVTVLSQTPSAFRQLILVDEERNADALALRYVVFGGEALDLASLAPWYARHPDGVPRLVNMYGITETCVHVTVLPLVREDAQASRGSRIGVPLAHLSTYVLDRDGEPCPVGVPGELHVGGAGVSLGYLGRPELTAERFIPNRFDVGSGGDTRNPGEGARLYRSGDLARWLEDGTLEYRGRIDHQVKLRGFRIELGEIEACLGALPEVREALVLVRRDAPDDDRIVGYVVAKGGVRLDVAGMRDELAKRLPVYMVPAAIVALDAFPLTENGKVDRRALPAPELTSSEIYVAPRTPTEQILAEVWAAVLHVDRVGIEDSYFELGGDSIRSIQVVARARERGLSLKVNDLFEHPTIAALAAVATAGAALTISQGAAEGEVPLLPIQRWFFDRSLPNENHFNQALFFKTPEPLAHEAVHEAVRQLLAHHDGLRLRFVKSAEGRVTQSYGVASDEEVDRVLLFVDLSTVPEGERTARVVAAAEAAERSLDLTRGPLARVVVMNLGSGGGRLLWIVHHLVVDGVSWRILLEDFLTALAVLSRGETPRLPGKTHSLAVWADRLWALARSEDLRAELPYWVATASGAGVRVPRDHEGGTPRVGAAREVGFEIEADATKMLLRGAPRAFRAQINAVLLTALARAFATWCGSRTMSLVLEGHGREPIDDVDVTRTVGWFTSLYPLVLTVGDHADPAEDVAAVRQQLDAIPRRGLGYLLLRYDGGEGELALSRVGLPDIVFNYLGQTAGAVGSDTGITGAPEPAGADVDPDARRAHVLEINAVVTGDRLRGTLSYSPELHDEATIERLATAFAGELVALADAARAIGASDDDDEEPAAGEEDPVTPVPRTGLLPLSFSQERAWFLEQLDPGHPGYNSAFPARIRGSIRRDVLELALAAVVDRHEGLRTRYPAIDGRPMQAIDEAAKMTLRFEDVGGAPEASREEAARRVLTEDARRPFDLEAGPVARATLVRVADDDHHLLLVFHLIAADRWSMLLFVRELAAAYGAAARGRPLPLPPLAFQYADYAAWQRRRLRGARLEQQLEYWRGQLADVPALELPADRPRPPTPSGRGARALVEIDPDVSAKLGALARKEGATPFMALLAAFEVLLQRLSGQERFAVGTPIANRRTPDLERVFGYFANLVAFRADLAERPTFRGLLRRVRASCLSAFENDEMPFERLVEALGQERDPSRNPIFQVMFVLHRADKAAEGSSALRIEVPDQGEWTTAQFDLRLDLAEAHGGYFGTFEYSTDLFDAATITRWVGHFLTLLRALARDPDARVDEVPLLDGDERARALVTWNDTAVDAPRDVLLHELAERAADASPGGIAVVQGKVKLTHAELEARANAAAAWLRDRGSGPGELVAVAMHKGWEQIVAVLAIHKAGAAYLPLDPALPEDRFRYLLSAGGVRLGITQPKTAGSLAWPGGVEVLTLAEGGAEPASRPTRSGSADGLAYVIYTSGSTGVPKGVALDHRGPVNTLLDVNRRFDVGPSDRTLLLSALNFDLSVYDVFGLLAAGGAVVVPDAEREREPAHWAELLESEAVSIWNTVPALLEMLVDYAEGGGRVRAPALRLALLSGDWVPLSLPDRARALFPGLRVISMGGATEASVWSILFPIDEVDPSWPSIPYGRPMANQKFYVFDGALEPCPVGVVGELYIAGVGLAKGYFRDEARTNESFFPHPRTGERLYRTGDLGRYRADGVIQFLGRRDGQVKVRGYRIELGEIEAALRDDARVRDSVAIVREDVPGAKRIVAYVVATSDVSTDDILARLRGKLPAYMVPEGVVLLERLPLTGNGKVNRAALPAPEETRIEVAYVAPRTDTERLVAELWASILHVERAGVNDGFFTLGGHSLLATQVVSRLRQRRGVELPLRTVFEAPTLEAFAARVDMAARDTARSADPIARADRSRPLPLSFAQERLWLLQQIDPAGTAYVMTASVRIAGALDTVALERATSALVERHEALRTTFPLDGDAPVQRIDAAPQRVPLVVDDFSSHPDAEREAAVRARFSEYARTPFDLAAGPLVRVHVARVTPDEHVVLLAVHHIVSDGVSQLVLARDLGALYRSFTTGTPANLPELSIQYADYAAWQRARLSGEGLARELGFWKDHLGGAPPSTDLPTDRDAPPRRAFRGDAVSIHLPSAAYRALQAATRARGTTLFVMMLAALDALLMRWTEQRDQVVGTVVANRDRAEVEELIGVFINFLAIRVRVDEGDTLAELVTRVHERVLTCFAHQDCPFDQVVAAINPDRSIARNPLYNVGFLLQNFGPDAARAPSTARGEPRVRAEATTRDAALLDLRVVATVGEDAIEIVAEYDVDLFDQATVEALIRTYATMLEAVAAAPSTRVGELSVDPELAARARAARARSPDQTLAVAATFTAEPIEDALRFWTDAMGARARVRFAPFNQVFQTLLDPTGVFATNRRGANVVLIRWEDLGEGDATGELGRALVAATSATSVPLIVLSCPATARHTAVSEESDARLAAVLAAAPGVTFVPSAEVLALYPSTEVHDEYGDRLGSVPYTPAFFAALATRAARALFAATTPPIKVIVTDLDQTLWKGVCGEDGPLGVEIDAGRRALQERLVALRERGVLLCVASKNNEEDALAVFAQRTDMPLRRAHFTIFSASWAPKSESIRAMADKLRLDLSSFVFLDDDPVQCAEVEAACAPALVLPVPLSGSSIPAWLDHLWVLDARKVTAEDRERAGRYAEEEGRQEALRTAPTLRDFVERLELRVDIDSMSAEDVPRVAQLTQRTNQFNCTTIRRTEAEITKLTDAGELHCSTVRVRDRFGEYGLVGVVLHRVASTTLHVDTLLLSCRVLGRGVEHAIVAHMGRVAQSLGAERVAIDFTPSAKNRPAKDFLDSLEAATRREEGGASYELSVSAAMAVEFRPEKPSAEATVTPQVEDRAAAPAPNRIAPEVSALAVRFASPDDLVAHLGDLRAASRRGPERAYAAPDGVVEQVLCGVFADVLALTRVGADDDFFSSGGQSLLATRVLSRVRHALGVELPLRAVFDAPTPRALAKIVEEVRGASSGEGRPRLERVPRDRPLPLSFSQERLYFIEQFLPGNPAYNVPLCVRLRGPLSREALAGALADLAARHESLRTTFRTVEGVPRQIVGEAGPVAVVEQDLSRVEEAELDAEVNRRVLREVRAPFDVEHGPLVRVALLRRSPDEHVLVITLHHLVCDGWSFGVLIRDLLVLYAARRADRSAPLPSLPVQYADYAVWQRAWLTGPTLEAELAFWRGELAGVSALDLPLDTPRPPVQSYRGARVPLVLPRALTSALSELSRREGVTPFMTLVAAFGVLLGKLSGQDDVAIGTPIAGRTASETEGLVGLFLNTLVLRVDLSGAPTFTQVLRATRRRTLAAYEHQHVPFEKVVDAAAPPRDPARTPLFQVMLVLQNWAEATGARGGAATDTSFEVLRPDPGVAQFDLTLSLGQDGDELAGYLEYATDLFSRATAERMTAELQTTLAALVARPDARIGELASATPAEARAAIDLALGRAIDVVPARLHELLAAQAARTPDAPAVLHGDTTMSYRELDAAADRWASALRGRGVRAEVLVGVGLERSPELVVALLAVLKAGGAYVPLDPTYPAERLKHIVADARVGVVIAKRSDAERFVTAGVTVLSSDDLDGAPAGSSGPPASWDTPAYVLYTSGSTGTPKGVVVTHRGLVHHMAWMQRAYPLGPEDAVLQRTPTGFDASVWEVWAPLLVGARLVMAGPEGHRDPADIVRTVIDCRVTVLQLVPSLLREVAREGDWAKACTLLERVFVGGEALPQDVAQAAAAGGLRRLVNLYGPTEATIDATAADCIEGGAACEITLGRPIDGTRAFVVDGHLRAVSVGALGELVLEGPCLARGYLGRADLTAERFVPSPFTPGERMYRTGDVARWRADGRLEYRGRKDDQVKIRGVRIELAEVEAALARCRNVRACAVAMREATSGHPQLVGYVVGDGVTAEALREELGLLLPAPLVPTTYVTIPELPRTPSGKVDRRALPAPVWQPSRDRHAPPRTPAEKSLASVWAAVLRVADVGIDDNYFDLGGDSIRSLQVVSLARDAGVPVSVPLLFQHPTIRALAAAIGDDAGSEDVDVSMSLLRDEDRAKLPAGVEDAYPLAALQAGMLYHTALSPEVPVYQQTMSFHLAGPVDVDAVRTALSALCAAHEVLRTSFDLTTYSEPLQLVHAHADVPLEVADVSDLPASERDARVAAAIEAEKLGRFDLSSARLLRLRIHRRAEDEMELTLTFHHAIVDGWSVGTLLSDLFRLYVAALDGEDVSLEPPRARFRDYVALERRTLASPDAARFWGNQLDGAVATRLPRWPSSASAGGDPRVVDVSIPDDVADGLRALARDIGVPIKSVLLAAHLYALSLATGGDDVMTGVVASGRPETADGVRVAGLFLNTLPHRQNVDVPTWRHLVRETFEAERAMLPFRRYPLAELQKRHGREPLFETLFNFVSFHVYDAVRATPRLRVLGTTLFEQTNVPLAALFSADLGNGRPRLALSHHRAEIPDEQADAIGSYYAAVLSEMALRPADRPSHAKLVPGGERATLAAWASSSAARETLLPAAIERRAAETPDAVAIAAPDATLSYRELDRRANHLAHALRLAGVGEESLVAVCAPRSSRALVALLAVWKAGAAYVPIDVDAPSARRARLVADSGAVAIVTHRDVSGLPAIPRFDLDDPATGGVRDAPPQRSTLPESLAYVVYTSGSTGEPKGVLVPHRGIGGHTTARADLMGVLPSDRLLQIHSLAFDAAAAEIFPAWFSGASVVLPPWRVPESAEALSRFLDETGVTIADLPPGLFHTLARAIARGEAPAPQSLRMLVMGGEALRSDRLAQWFDAIGERVAVLDSYGPTEASVAVTAHRVGRFDLAGKRPVPIGAAIAGARLYVLDRRLEPAPIGVPGELCIGGPGVARGYLGRPDLTAERFLPDPHAETPGARMYRTGDVCRWLPNGELELLGRADRQVKVRGHRVELGEIEVALQRHPGVADAVVLAGARAGETELTAYIVPLDGATVAPSDVRAALLAAMPDHMVPAGYVLVGALPRGTTGKVDRRALAALPSESARGERVGPRDEIERALVDVWSRVLETEVGVTDDYFSLGGHSLLAVRLVPEMNERLGAHLTIGALLAHSTIERLAAVVRGAHGDSPAPLVTRIQSGVLPALFLVHAIGGHVLAYAALARALGGRAVYGIRAEGLEATDPTPATTLVETAARYADAIRAIQPEGPYLVSGWSMGGVVATEIARNLRDAGGRVRLLALLDAHIVRSDEVDLGGEAGLAASFLAESLGVPVPLLPTAALTLSGTTAEARVRDAVARGVAPRGVPEAELARQLAVYRRNLELQRDHTPASLDVPTLLLQAEEADASLRERSAARWRRVAGGPIDVEIVAGDHHSLLRTPAVEGVAVRLRAAIDEALRT